MESFDEESNERKKISEASNDDTENLIVKSIKFEI